MDLEQFNKSLLEDIPPENLGAPLIALWWEKKGDWNRGHKLVQGEDTKTSAWVHAYLHRREGDLSNSAYWYSLAKKTQSKKSLDGEWEEIVKALLL